MKCNCMKVKLLITCVCGRGGGRFISNVSACEREGIKYDCYTECRAENGRRIHVDKATINHSTAPFFCHVVNDGSLLAWERISVGVAINWTDASSPNLPYNVDPCKTDVWSYRKDPRQ